MTHSGTEKFKMASSIEEKKKVSLADQCNQKVKISPGDTSKQDEKVKKMKEQLVNAQAAGGKETKTTGNAKADMSAEEKQNMEKFFEWTPPPPPETMGQKFKRKMKQNPLVPLGALATVGALTYGLFSFVRGDTKMQQYMMRARVAAQGGTIVAVAGGVLYMLIRDHRNKKV